jgi:hypothetical protein
MVEAAILLPILIIIALGGISIDSYIQAQAQVTQAVSRAALVAARNTYDPCMAGDEPGAPLTTNGQPHGFQDVVDAFHNALSSPLLSNNSGTLTITCTSNPDIIGPQVSVTTTIVGSNPPSPPVISTPLSNWGGWGSLQPPVPPATCTSGSPADGGCFALWRGGIVTVKYTTTLNIRWTPFWHSVTIGASGGEQIEPYRQHTCYNPPAVGTPAC